MTEIYRPIGGLNSNEYTQCQLRYPTRMHSMCHKLGGEKAVLSQGQDIREPT